MNEVDLDMLKERINIVEYIGQFVHLEFNNGEWWGLCPFHDEKTPSFDVNEEKRSYYCHGCKNGGTIIDFASNYYKISVAQAIEKLAEEFKISRNKIPSLMRISKKFAPKKPDKKVIIPTEYIEDPITNTKNRISKSGLQKASNKA